MVWSTGTRIDWKPRQKKKKKKTDGRQWSSISQLNVKCENKKKYIYTYLVDIFSNHYFGIVFPLSNVWWKIKKV